MSHSFTVGMCVWMHLVMDFFFLLLSYALLLCVWVRGRVCVCFKGGCDYAEVAGANQWLCVSNYSGTEPIDQPLQSNLFTTDV